MIRKIQFAPASSKEGPKTEINKQFMMSDKPVQLEVSLGKEVRQTFAIRTRRPLPRNPWDFFFPVSSPLTVNLSWNPDLLPRRSRRYHGENQQRNHQGREENQSDRWGRQTVWVNFWTFDFCPIVFLTEVLLPLSVEQLTNVVLYSSDTYSKAVCSEEFGWVGGLHGEQSLHNAWNSFLKKFNPWLTGFLSTLQGDSKPQLHPGEVPPNHSSAGQQQGEAWTLRGWTAKRRGHPPGIHHPVSHPARRFEGEGLSRDLGGLCCVVVVFFDPLIEWAQT